MDGGVVASPRHVVPSWLCGQFEVVLVGTTNKAARAAPFQHLVEDQRCDRRWTRPIRILLRNGRYDSSRKPNRAH